MVEDDQIISADLKKSLTILGYQVYDPVRSGIDAVNIALSLKPDIILMDIKLKDKIDGIDAAKTINLNFKIPIIFLTAYGTEKAFKKIKHVSDYKIIQKPYEISEIDEAIRKALNSN